MQDIVVEEGMAGIVCAAAPFISMVPSATLNVPELLMAPAIINLPR